MSVLTNKYIKWEDLFAELNSINPNYKHGRSPNPDHYGVMVNESLPFSISEYEFNYMRDYIIKHNLKKGFELATGTGISTIAIGDAFKQTGGKLDSLDSYEEYVSKEQPIGIVKDEINDSPMYSVCKNILNTFDLGNNVELHNGWSPVYSKKMLKDNNIKLDFAFFDCPKCSNDFVRDTEFLPEFLDEKFAIFVHDTHFYKEEFINLSKSIFKIDPLFIHDFSFNNGVKYHARWPIALITNIEQ